MLQLDYSRNFSSDENESLNRKTFLENLATIERHNKLFDDGKVSFKLAVNKFADMMFEEFLRMNTMDETLEVPSNLPFDPVEFEADKVPLPASFDWRSRIALSRVKDQLRCGSCYAMSALDTVESQLMIKFIKSHELSVQEIVDCAGNYQTFGCEGGVKFRVFDYISDNGGISLEHDYSYKASKAKCEAVKHNKLRVNISGYGRVANFDEAALKEALVRVGPISVSIDINHESFMRYSSGIYFEPNCTTETNHAAVLVGYGSEQGEDFWTIKNSYGDKWGEGGYIRLARNRDSHCGISTDSIYPIL